MEREVSLPCL